jgi:hypothetical protein
VHCFYLMQLRFGRRTTKGSHATYGDQQNDSATCSSPLRPASLAVAGRGAGDTAICCRLHPPVLAQDRKPAGTSLRMTVSETPGRNNGQQTTDLPPTTLSSPVVLWDNGPFNNVTGLASEENTFVTSARTADDFVLTSSATIHTITFDIYQKNAVKPCTLGQGYKAHAVLSSQTCDKIAV